LYPVTVRVADARGVWRYVPGEHAIMRDGANDRRDALAVASFSQETVRNAPAVLVITADFSIPARKYGRRGERFATLEAGHVAQNVLLEATALGLGAVTIGAFDEDALRRTLTLPSSETPLYLIPVGALP
jgi:SagB-type dehydrogenase family enzyme